MKPSILNRLPGSDGELFDLTLTKDRGISLFAGEIGQVGGTSAMSSWLNNGMFNFGLFVLSASVLLMLCALTWFSLMRLKPQQIRRRIPLLASNSSTTLASATSSRRAMTSNSHSGQSLRLNFNTTSNGSSSSGKCLTLLKNGITPDTSNPSIPLSSNPSATDDLHCALSRDGCCDLNYCDQLVITNAMASQLARTYSTVNALARNPSYGRLDDRSLLTNHNRIHASTGRLYEQLRHRSFAELSTINTLGAAGGCAARAMPGNSSFHRLFAPLPSDLMSNGADSSSLTSVHCLAAGGSMGRLPTPPPPYTESAYGTARPPGNSHSSFVAPSTLNAGPTFSTAAFNMYSNTVNPRSGYATWAFHRASEKPSVLALYAKDPQIMTNLPTSTIGAPSTSDHGHRCEHLPIARAEPSCHDRSFESSKCTASEASAANEKPVKSFDPYYSGATTLVVDVSGRPNRHLSSTYAALWKKPTTVASNVGADAQTVIAQDYSCENGAVGLSSKQFNRPNDERSKVMNVNNDEPLIALHDDDPDEETKRDQDDRPTAIVGPDDSDNRDESADGQDECADKTLSESLRSKLNGSTSVESTF
jgi:hypothetical protein